MALDHDFINVVFDPIIEMEGTEWGEGVGALLRAHLYGYLWSDEQMDTMAELLKDAIIEVWPDLVDNYDESDIHEALHQAQSRFPPNMPTNLRETYEWLPNFLKQEPPPPPVDRFAEQIRGFLTQAGIEATDEQVGGLAASLRRSP